MDINEIRAMVEAAIEEPGSIDIEAMVEATNYLAERYKPSEELYSADRYDDGGIRVDDAGECYEALCELYGMASDDDIIHIAKYIFCLL